MHTFSILQQIQGQKVLDVRSPGEFSRGHIPGAISFPLFFDEERAAVGTIYKQKGKDAAVLKGLEYVGPRMAQMVTKAMEISADRQVLVHCWRGGMRSASVAWLLKQAGFSVRLIAGGYKAYRHEVQDYLAHPHRFIVLSGATGSGKTAILAELKALGEQVVDLEGLARHKGSSFGALGMQEQPAIEQFENLLVHELLRFDRNRPVWIEDESRKIGRVVLHEGFWLQKLQAPLVKISVPLDERVHHLVQDYGRFSVEDLEAGLRRIGKRLGPQHLKYALEALESGNLHEVARTCLVYYDKAYLHAFERSGRDKVIEVNFSHMDPKRIALEIQKLPDHFSQ